MIRHSLTSPVRELSRNMAFFVDVFGGPPTFFLAKIRRPQLLVTNDYDFRAVSFFRALRECPDETIAAIRKLSLNRRTKARECKEKEFRADTEAAARWARTTCLVDTERGSDEATRLWRDCQHDPIAFAERLTAVQYDCLDPMEIANRYNTPDSFLFVEPPKNFSAKKTRLLAEFLREVKGSGALHVRRGFKRGPLLHGIWPLWRTWHGALVFISENSFRNKAEE